MRILSRTGFLATPQVAKKLAERGEEARLLRLLWLPSSKPTKVKPTERGQRGRSVCGAWPLVNDIGAITGCDAPRVWLRKGNGGAWTADEKAAEAIET